jgi:hypothetical protein
VITCIDTKHNKNCRSNIRWLACTSRLYCNSTYKAMYQGGSQNFSGFVGRSYRPFRNDSNYDTITDQIFGEELLR